MTDGRSQLLGNQTVKLLVTLRTRFELGDDDELEETYAGTVKPFDLNMGRLHDELLRWNLQLHDNQPFGPPGGRQLFYVQDCTAQDARGRWVLNGILVRIKSKGNGRPPRMGLPHMSVSLYNAGLGWNEEQAKFNVHGKTTPKLAPASWADIAKDDWADACHFNFLPGFDFTRAGNLAPGNYALRDLIWKALKG